MMQCDFLAMIPMQLGLERIQGTVFGFVKHHQALYTIANLAVIFVLLFRTDWILQVKKQNTFSQWLWIITIVLIFLTFSLSFASYISVVQLHQ